MTTHQLFHRLCAVTDALQAEIAREDDSPHQLALSAVVGQLDALIDELVDTDLTPSGREPLFWDLPLPLDRGPELAPGSTRGQACAPTTKERA